MNIHAIQTGTVAITTAWREGVGHGRRRLLNTILDRNWTEPLPIFAFAIEHPERVIVVDTGERALASGPGYFPPWHPVFRLAVREWVEPEQEIGPQLERLGIGRSDLGRVVMTHLHTDHAGGLHHFPDTEILVARAPSSNTQAGSAASCAATRTRTGRPGSTRPRSTSSPSRWAPSRRAYA
jgi:glyoxylase-like metal-dependent hydrolase (beta-lactamase superfamily II)